MKRILLTLIVAFTAFANALAVDLIWGKATWNIQNGTVFEDINDINLQTIKLTFENFKNASTGKKYFISGDLLSVNYDIYVDDATEPIKETATGEMGGLEVVFDYKWVEGHSYRVVTTNAKLMYPNMATYITDTLSMSDTPYTISFSINGPEIVKTIEVEGTMALSIIDQTSQPTISTINTKEICTALGINNISEAEYIYGLCANGAYFPNYIDPCDGWRDADGEYTTYYGYDNASIRNILGHRPYPSVYCIKLNETCDTVSYFFYDYWKEYDPEEPESVPGTGSGAKMRVMRRASVPNTVYNDSIWAWNWTTEEGVDTTTLYRRSYRVTEGQDYKAGFIVMANGKAVTINATLHFVDGQTYEAYIKKERNSFDIDGDGRITAADITKLINIYLSKKQ